MTHNYVLFPPPFTRLVALHHLLLRQPATGNWPLSPLPIFMDRFRFYLGWFRQGGWSKRCSQRSYISLPSLLPSPNFTPSFFRGWCPLLPFWPLWLLGVEEDLRDFPYFHGRGRAPKLWFSETCGMAMRILHLCAGGLRRVGRPWPCPRPDASRCRTTTGARSSRATQCL
jgi:hypothetical protein